MGGWGYLRKEYCNSWWRAYNLYLSCINVCDQFFSFLIVGLMVMWDLDVLKLLCLVLVGSTIYATEGSILVGVLPSLKSGRLVEEWNFLVRCMHGWDAWLDGSWWSCWSRVMNKREQSDKNNARWNKILDLIWILVCSNLKSVYNALI